MNAITNNGGPVNWWCDEAGIAMIEDGSLAGMVLAGKLSGEQLGALEDGEVAAAEAQPATAGWDGTEEWEALAWHLCAEENGEDACNELVWEGGPMPEPWGDRWLKYEGAAKDMIARVRKFAPQPAAQALTDEQIAALVLATVYEGDSSTAHRDAWAAEIGVPFARAIERAHGIGGQP